MMTAFHEENKKQKTLIHTIVIRGLLFEEHGGGEDILASVCLFIFIDVEKIQKTILPQFCN